MSEQPFYTGNKEPKNRPQTSTVIRRNGAYAMVRKEDCVLVIQSAPARWELPGGGIEDGETISQALEREVYEETGYRVRQTSAQPVWVIENRHVTRDGRYFQGIGLVYEAELISNEQVIDEAARSAGEIIHAIDWMPLNELAKENVYHTFWPFVDSLQRR